MGSVVQRQELTTTASKRFHTVKGELRVANFLVNSFKRSPFPDICGCASLPNCALRYYTDGIVARKTCIVQS